MSEKGTKHEVERDRGAKTRECGDRRSATGVRIGHLRFKVKDSPDIVIIVITPSHASPASGYRVYHRRSWREWRGLVVIFLIWQTARCLSAPCCRSGPVIAEINFSKKGGVVIRGQNRPQPRPKVSDQLWNVVTLAFFTVGGLFVFNKKKKKN